MNKVAFFSAVVFVSFLIAINTFYIVDQRQSALVLQFGDPVRSVFEPGLKFKMPFIQNVIFFEKRIQNLHADTSEVIAADQKTMRVDAFAKYKITDPLKFYQSARDESGFKNRLSPILNSALRQVLGERPFKSLLTKERSILMHNIRDAVNAEALGFGVAVIDVRIMRADLPDKSRDAVYQRMRTERSKEAKEIRAEGAEEAQRIISKADKDKQILLADAGKEAQMIMGSGDSEATQVFASAYNKDPSFYAFYRSMQAYENSIIPSKSSILLSSDNDFMEYFGSSKKNTGK